MLNILRKKKNKSVIKLQNKIGIVVRPTQPTEPTEPTKPTEPNKATEPPPFEEIDFFDFSQEKSLCANTILAVNRLPYQFEISNVRSLNPADNNCRKQKIVLAIFPSEKDKLEIRPFSTLIPEIEAAKMRFNLEDEM